MEVNPNDVLGREGARLAVDVEDMVLRDPYWDDPLVLRVVADIPMEGIFEVGLVVELRDFELKCPGRVRDGETGFLFELISRAGRESDLQRNEPQAWQASQHTGCLNLLPFQQAV